VTVLGAGLMGVGNAQISIGHGKYRVILKDKDASGVSRGEKVIEEALQGKLKKQRWINHEYCGTTSRLLPLHDGQNTLKQHFAQANTAIEAVTAT